MAKIIPISFKENHRDINLYIQIMSRNDKSSFVKDCVEFFLNHQNEEEIQKPLPRKPQKQIIDEDPQDDDSMELLNILNS